MHATERLDALTGLRFVAAAMILIHHSAYLGVTVPDFKFGHGVSFFFVLSGFILAYAHPRLDGWRATGRFIANRLARIWPAHVVTLVAAVVIFSQPTGPHTLANLLLVHGWVPSSDFYFSHNAVSWSISTEMGFYLAFPLLIHKWRSTWAWKLALVAVMSVASIRAVDIFDLGSFSGEPRVTGHGLVYVTPVGRLLEFTVGIACCSAYRWLRPRVPAAGLAYSYAEIAAVAFFLYTASGAFAGLFWTNAGPGFREWLNGSSSLPSCAVLVTVFAFGRGDISRVLKTRVFQFLGEISYSLYLCHMLVFLYAYWNLRAPEPAFVSVALPIAISLACAAFLWRYVEVPARDAVRRIGRKSKPLPEGVTALRPAA